MTVLDELFAIATACGADLTLHRNRADGRWVARVGDRAATAVSPNGAVRALADKLVARPVLTLCQREESHG